MNCEGVESRSDDKYQDFTYEHRRPCALTDLRTLWVVLKRNIVWVILECDGPGGLPRSLDQLLDARTGLQGSVIWCALQRTKQMVNFFDDSEGEDYSFGFFDPQLTPRSQSHPSIF